MAKKDKYTNPMIVKFLRDNGFELWSKAGAGRERVYVNSQGLFELGLKKDKVTMDAFKQVKMHYDVFGDVFYYSNVTSDHIDELDSLVEIIRANAIKKYS